MRRHWLPSEDTIIRATMAKTARAVGLMLNRSESSINNRRRALRVTRRHRKFTTPAERDQIRNLNARGYTDPAIAGIMGRALCTIRLWRLRMGLPSQARSERQRDIMRRKMVAQCEANGVASLAELQQFGYRVRAVQRGWHPDCTPMMCDILDHLERGGKTRRELCAVMGKRYHRYRCLRITRNKSALRTLADLGLVTRSGRKVQRERGGPAAWVYSLAPGVIRQRRPERVAVPA